MAKYWLLLSNLSCNDQISLKIMWYVTINKMRVEFDKGGCALICTYVKTSDR